MPIEYRIDHSQRLVVANGRGTLLDQDVFGYQREVWSRLDVVGYNELIDMSAVERIALPSGDRVRELAQMSAFMDAPGTASKVAIVAPDNLAFGLGRMYAIYRSLDDDSTKQVSVFRSLEGALAFLGLESVEVKEGGGIGT